MDQGRARPAVGAGVFGGSGGPGGAALWRQRAPCCGRMSVASTPATATGFHRVAAEGVAQLLVQHHCDEGGLALLYLSLDGVVQLVGQVLGGAQQPARP